MAAPCGIRSTMKITLAIVLAVGLASHASAQSSTTVYKSTGPDGNTVYGDRPDPAARDTQTMTFEVLPSSPLSAKTLAFMEQLKKEGAERAAFVPQSNVVLFSAAWCGYCRKAKAFLALRQVPYREFDIDTDQGMAAFIGAGGRGGVPLLLVDGRRVGGFSVAAYDALFPARN
jgi:glutaredoxin